MTSYAGMHGTYVDRGVDANIIWSLARNGLRLPIFFVVANMTLYTAAIAAQRHPCSRKHGPCFINTAPVLIFHSGFLNVD